MLKTDYCNFFRALMLIRLLSDNCFQRSTATALCDITTEILRTINATESAMNELAPSNPNFRLQLVGTDLMQADDAYRELEENVSLSL